MDFCSLKRDDISDLSDCRDQLSAMLPCKVVHLGIFNFETKEQVIMTSKGIRIVAPLQEDPSKTCTLHIYKKDVIKVIAHLSTTTNSMLCFYIFRTCAQYIKKALRMPETIALFETQNNFAKTLYQAGIIILQLDSIDHHIQSIIRSIWNFLDEISASDAEGLLQRVTLFDRKGAGDKLINETNCQITQLLPNDIQQLLIYPPGKGGILIRTTDYLCLATGQYLNDIIIDFYLKWLNDCIPKAERDRTFIFSALFYQTLTSFSKCENDVNYIGAGEEHGRVRNWTKNVNLFEKDFIIIPINENSHWFLAIICFPSLKNPVTFGTHIPVELRDKDEGLANAYAGYYNEPTSKSIDYDCKSSIPYKMKMPGFPAHSFNKYNMLGHHVKVPQQNNSTDCGLYVLQYVEQFFKDPIRDYRIPIQQLANWFDTPTVTRKREDISNLLQKLMNASNGPNNKILLPVIPFPTHNGQLIELENNNIEFD
uniref:Ubiquitin-like protease family profile domain-containing protein n=1 Tax=Glossina brevipalpis TaxID=37001 RepID=A0A1A9WDN1_9MUSC